MFCWSSCVLNVIYIYLRIFDSNTISISDDDPILSFNNNTPGVTSGAGIAYTSFSKFDGVNIMRLIVLTDITTEMQFYYEPNK